ncbi:MAG: patatin-like phospholipase family protein [Wujia sp.]
MGENKKGVGLVLAGGGGKGAYQVGVLKALKENGMLDEVTGISGASIGAVNAFLYAMEDIDIMYKAWDDIDMLTLFDVDLEMLVQNRPYFSRDEMIKLISKYIDFDKLKNTKYKIFNSICRIDSASDKMVAEYRDVTSYDDVDYIKKILLASTALPIIYEAVEIDGSYYRDGGICDNEPVKPLYDLGYRQFIVIGMTQGKVFNQNKCPDAEVVAIYPSYDLGSLIDGTLNFTEKAVKFREMLGYKDGLRALKTKFQKDDMYIRMESVLAQNDLNEIKMQLRTEMVYKAAENSINSNIEKFNSIAKKYENF